MPKCFEITAESEDNEIMGIRHKELPLWGVQFHPESILTTEGKKLLDNFLKL
jgi:anthranilate/para-aminobenzoate synthase component II